MISLVQQEKTIGKAAMITGHLFWHGREMGARWGAPIMAQDRQFPFRSLCEVGLRDVQARGQGTFSYAFILIPQGEAAYALSGLH